VSPRRLPGFASLVFMGLAGASMFMAYHSFVTGVSTARDHEALLGMYWQNLEKQGVSAQSLHEEMPWLGTSEKYVPLTPRTTITPLHEMFGYSVRTLYELGRNAGLALGLNGAALLVAAFMLGRKDHDLAPQLDPLDRPGL
jgi:hypothetical protein